MKPSAEMSVRQEEEADGLRTAEGGEVAVDAKHAVPHVLVSVPSHPSAGAVETSDPAGEEVGALAASVPDEVVRSCGVALRRMGDSSLRSIAVTSTGRGEGRTTVALGFAASAIAQGRRSTVVELDFLNPSFDAVLGLDQAPGVIDVLNSRASLTECTRTITSGLTVVGAGHLEPGEAIGHMEGLARIVSDLQGETDLLVADLPPLDAGATAARIADLFDLPALVVRAGRTSLESVEGSIDLLQQTPCVILNAVGPARSRLRRWLSRLS